MLIGTYEIQEGTVAHLKKIKIELINSFPQMLKFQETRQWRSAERNFIIRSRSQENQHSEPIEQQHYSIHFSDASKIKTKKRNWPHATEKVSYTEEFSVIGNESDKSRS